ncbi:hypothetical protein [Breoghania sp. L-A4]|uniref:hypothetical protein n=1 Tax=Breoghania sp. L-A4 TaxID=2304600 RepID=UPI000E35DFB7|nr:hypothetical protein [Breoghania sp. L-A4]AXS41858.1 hypothetical protein D1F64_19900 [Breoghania sp. L-A4]
MDSETVFYVSAMVRLIMMVSLCAVSLGCIVVGTRIFGKAVTLFLQQGSQAEEEATVKMSRSNVEISFRGGSGLILIMLGIVAAIAVVRTEIRFEYDVEKGSFGIDQPISWLISGALAQGGGGNDVVADFCEFTLRGATSRVRIRAAGGSTLTTNRKRILSFLNQTMEGRFAQMSDAQIAGLAEDLAADPLLARHLRFVIVQSALPREETERYCRAGAYERTGTGEKIYELLVIGLKP